MHTGFRYSILHSPPLTRAEISLVKRHFPDLVKGDMAEKHSGLRWSQHRSGYARETLVFTNISHTSPSYGGIQRNHSCLQHLNPIRTYEPYPERCCTPQSRDVFFSIGHISRIRLQDDLPPLSGNSSSNNNTKNGHWILHLTSGIVHVVTGTIINATAIVLGSGLAMLSRKDLSESKQQKIKLALGCFAMVVGTHLIWTSMHGGVLRHGKQMLILFAAITLGNILGMILGIQKTLNRLAEYAKNQFERPDQANAFKLTSALFCLTPFAIIGAALDGISGNYSVLLIKAVMDGVAAHSFTRIFGKSVILSAIPVLALQGNLALFGRWLGNAHLSTHMIEGITGACGIMVFTSLVLIVGVGKPRLADYLPSIVVAAFLAHWFW